MINHLLEVVYGIIFGVANIIPGVSGGTMMVVFGVYDKLVDALSLKISSIKKNIVFIIFFGIGAAVGILGFSFVITWLFDNHPVPTNMFFIGLIAGSIPLIVKTATAEKKFRPTCLIAFIPAVALVVGLAVLDKNTGDNYAVIRNHLDMGTAITIENNGNHEIKSNWQLKIEAKIDASTLTEAKVLKSDDKTTTLTGLENSSIAPGSKLTINTAILLPEEDVDISFSYTYQMNVALFFTLLAGAALAAVAMIIPGVSGSFVMVLLGIYTTIIGAIKSLEFMILIPVAVGVIVGIVFGAKLISALMKRYSLMVYSVILGLVVGSLYAVLPEGIGINIETLIGAFALIAGGAISLITGRMTGKKVSQ